VIYTVHDNEVLVRVVRITQRARPTDLNQDSQVSARTRGQTGPDDTYDILTVGC
jgi:hypothetical protein